MVDTSVFSDLFGWNGDGICNLEANGVKYVGSVNFVTREYFSALGIQPIAGRLIAAEDVNRSGGPSTRLAEPPRSAGAWRSARDRAGRPRKSLRPPKARGFRLTSGG